MIASLISDRLASEQAYIEWVATMTSGSLAIAAVTFSTSTVEAILIPQWHINTPILGFSSVISRSGGYSLFVTIVPRAFASSSMDIEAAALAWVTVSGISLGSWNTPATNIPGLDVSRGKKRSVAQKPYSFNSMPSLEIVEETDFLIYPDGLW